MIAPDLDLLPTDIEKDLRDTVRDLLADRCPSSAVAAIYDGDRSLVVPLWQALSVDLGLAGLLVPEELGGSGASAREAGAVLEELGRACAPVPFLTSSVIATIALLEAESETAQAALRSLAEGSSTAALIVPFSSSPGATLPDVTATESRLTGVVRSVAGALEAQLLLVPAGDGLYLVSRDDAEVSPISSLDMTRQLADVSLVDAPGRLVHSDARGVVLKALVAGAGLLASEQAGVARWCLEETVAYLKVRKQFGRVVGGFQALKHRLADLYAEVESGAAAARYAAAAFAAGEDVEIAAMVAATYDSEAAVHAAEEAVQLHGGIGMTWEHPTHLYLKKAKADQIGLGTPGVLRRRLAPLVELNL